MVLSASTPDLASTDDDWTEEPRAYLLPEMDREKDKAERERLDEDTKIRRRVYEMLLVSACPRLKALDGLPLCKEEVVIKDGTWDRLVELGVLKRRGEGGARKMIEGSGYGDGMGEGAA